MTTIDWQTSRPFAGRSEGAGGTSTPFDVAADDEYVGKHRKPGVMRNAIARLSLLRMLYVARHLR